MQNAVRQHLRQAIDTHRRARRQALIDAGELQVCTGCGCDADQRTPKCGRCYDRQRRRERRADPAYVAAEQARQRSGRRSRAKTSSVSFPSRPAVAPRVAGTYANGRRPTPPSGKILLVGTSENEEE